MTERPTINLTLTPLEGRVLFHMVSEHMSVDRITQLFPHANEREAARSAYQKLRTMVYGDRNIK